MMTKGNFKVIARELEELYINIIMKLRNAFAIALISKVAVTKSRLNIHYVDRNIILGLLRKQKT